MGGVFLEGTIDPWAPLFSEVWKNIDSHMFFFEKGMGVEPKIGVKPPKWMVKIMENPINMDYLGGFPIIFGNTHMLNAFLRLTSKGFVGGGPTLKQSRHFKYII